MAVSNSLIYCCKISTTLMASLLTQTLCRATLKEKSYKKVQGKPDRSARFAGPAPPIA